jgi:hypothetical protein
MTNRLSQKSGENSQQIQAEMVVVNNGISEQRVREIVNEKLTITLQGFTAEAMSTATERNNIFSRKLIDRMQEEQALSAFSDPAFQMLLLEAQKRAASTEREPDYELLSELMLHRFKKGVNRNVRAGISRAVEIVDQISDEALLGLTLIHAVNFTPTAGKMSVGLDVLENLFKKLIYANLPTGTEWLDHLDILDAARISSIGGMIKIEEFWFEQFDGYVSKGVEKDSEKYNEILNILQSINLGKDCLTAHEHIENYVKIELFNKNVIKTITILSSASVATPHRSLTDNEIAALEKVYDLCSAKKIDKKILIDEIEKRENLKKLREWWNKLTQSIQITSVGRVLAHSNAQRIDKRLPPLN